MNQQQLSNVQVGDIQQLADELQLKYGTRTNIFVGDGGGIMLDIWIGERAYVLAYSANWDCLGFDEMDWNGGIGTDFQHSFPTLAAAREHILTLIPAVELVPSS